MLDTAGEIRTNSWVLFPNRLLHMYTPLLANQQKLTFCVDTGCNLEDLPIGMDGKRESKDSMLLAPLDDDDYDTVKIISAFICIFYQF